MVVEHNAALRDGLFALISEQPDMQVVSTAGHAREAMRAIQRSEPDVAIVDANIPGALDLMRRFCSEYPSMKLIPLVNYEWDSDVAAAVAASGEPCIPKDHISQRLLSRIRGRAEE